MSFGASGGSSSSSSTTNSNQNTSNMDWLLNQFGGQLAGIIGGAIGNYKPSDKDYIGPNQWQEGALGGLAGGNKDIWDKLSGIGSGNMQTGSQAQAGALGSLGAILGPGGALTAEGIYNTAQGLVNHDAIKSQTEALQQTVSKGLGKAVQGINQGATSTGGMGSSRAGVMEGVATEGAANALAQGSAAITSSAYDKATDAAIKAGQQQLAGLGLQGQIGNALQGSGLEGLLAGTAGNRQDLLDKLQAGNIWQSEEEKKAAIDRYNEMVKQNPSLAALGELGPLILQFAGLGGTSNTTGSSTTTGSSSDKNFGFKF